jgi:hypothetical protein
MDWNVYVLEQQVAMKLEEARARRAHASLVASLGPRRVGALAVLGLGLIKIGRFVERRGGVRRRPARAPVPTLPCPAVASAANRPMGSAE